MSENLTPGRERVDPLTFVTPAFRQAHHFGTAIATLVAFPPFNYRGVQAVSASIPHPVALPLIVSAALGTIA